MPRALARALTASSSGSGRRMLTRAAFFSNSNRTGLNWEKSRSERSCSRKASASSSVVNLGTFRFIACDLLPVHVAGAYRSDKPLVVLHPEREGHENRPACRVPPDRDEPVLLRRVMRVGSNARVAAQKRLDLADRHPVFLALIQVPSSQSNPATVSSMI